MPQSEWGPLREGKRWPGRHPSTGPVGCGDAVQITTGGGGLGQPPTPNTAQHGCQCCIGGAKIDHWTRQ
ncbi:UNVERIFIED_CONTAM: hypothetical protein K2H54_050391 [Gekko kuhli]